MGTVTITAGLAIDTNASDQGTTARGFRLGLGVLFHQSSPGVPIPGRLGATHFAVTGKANMSYGVSAGGVVLTRDGQGAYLVGSDEDVTFTTDATLGVNPRYDRIYVVQPDPAIDGDSVAVGAIIGVAVGTPGGTPALPTLPDGALELARALVPANATRTDGITFTNIAPVVGLNVGQIPLANGGTGAGTKPAARTNLGILTGTGVPSNSLGEDGDIYFQIL